MVGTNMLVIPPLRLDLGFIEFGLKKYNELISQEGLQGTFVRHSIGAYILGILED